MRDKKERFASRESYKRAWPSKIIHHHQSHANLGARVCSFPPVNHVVQARWDPISPWKFVNSSPVVPIHHWNSWFLDSQVGNWSPWSNPSPTRRTTMRFCFLWSLLRLFFPRIFWLPNPYVFKDLMFFCSSRFFFFSGSGLWNWGISMIKSGKLEKFYLFEIVSVYGIFHWSLADLIRYLILGKCSMNRIWFWIFKAWSIVHRDLWLYKKNKVVVGL